MSFKGANKFKVGDYVYKPYAQLIGKVIEIIPHENKPSYPNLRIKWTDGKEDIRWSLNVRNLNALIADHKKKLRGHKERLAEAKELIENGIR